MNFCLKVLAWLTFYNCGEKYIQVNSLSGNIIVKFSLNQRVTILHFFQTFKRQRASGNPRWGFLEFKEASKHVRESLGLFSLV